jgi:hypothetical protein
MEAATFGAGTDFVPHMSEFTYVPPTDRLASSASEAPPRRMKQDDPSEMTERCLPGPMANRADDVIAVTTTQFRKLTLHNPKPKMAVPDPQLPPYQYYAQPTTRRPGKKAHSVDGVPYTCKLIAPCRRPRAYTLDDRQHQLPLPVSRPLMSMSMGLFWPVPETPQVTHSVRPSSAQSAPVLSDPPVMASDFEPVSVAPSRASKRRLSLDMDIPPSVLRRRGAISPLATPTIELAVKRARARLCAEDNVFANTTTSDDAYPSSITSMMSTIDTLVTSKDDDNNEPAQDVCTAKRD